MTHLKELVITLTTATLLGGMPTAFAQTDAPDEGIPYAITFNGTHHPASLQTIEYPFAAASQMRDGECVLNVISDDVGNVASMSIITCSDETFRAAATRYINAQSMNQNTSPGLKAHPLRINWDIGNEIEPERPIQIATR